MRSAKGVVVLTAFTATCLAHLNARGAQPAAATTPPPEITVSSTPIGPVFADSDGYTLYVTRRDTEPNVSTCFGSCTSVWLPMRASSDAIPSGDWSLVSRTDGAAQWAFKGRPLYRYRWEQNKNWAIGQGDLWQIATLDPFPDWSRRRRSFLRTNAAQTRFSVKNAPPGIVAETTPLGVVLADAQGKTLYVALANCGPGCDAMLRPLPAPAAAVPIGDWAVVPRLDGVAQWTYQGQPLFRCTRDVMRGEATCVQDGGKIIAVPSTLLVREDGDVGEGNMVRRERQ